MYPVQSHDLFRFIRSVLHPLPPSHPTHHQVELTTLLLSSPECQRHNIAAGLMTRPQSRSPTFGLRWTGIKHTNGLHGVCYGQAKALLRFSFPDRCPDEHRIPPEELCSPKNPPLPEPHPRTPRTVKKQKQYGRQLASRCVLVMARSRTNQFERTTL